MESREEGLSYFGRRKHEQNCTLKFCYSICLVFERSRQDFDKTNKYCLWSRSTLRKYKANYDSQEVQFREEQSIFTFCKMFTRVSPWYMK